MTEPVFVPLTDYRELAVAEMQRRAAELLDEMQRRRSVRQFSRRPVPREVIRNCVAVAATAPSGANLQPWHFVVVEDPEVKSRIRQAAEREEREFYEHRAPKQWLNALAPLGTTASKPFLEDAPYLVVVFAQMTGRTADGKVRKHYYPLESTSIAIGMLITALHHAGLVCLPYTPSRMGFLNEILERPKNERPVMIVVAGYPAEGAVVPQLFRKPLEEKVTFL